MEKIIVSESGNDCSHISYLYHMINNRAYAKDASVHLNLGYDRMSLEISVNKEDKTYFRTLTENAVADILVIGYKYGFLRRILPLSFLNPTERELLYTALISADYSDDRKFVVKKISSMQEYSVDGLYNFRLNALKEKWEEIASYIPEQFSSFEFDRFMAFLLEGESGRIFIKDSEIYNEKYFKLRRSRLIGSYPEYSFLREVILSGANHICCLTMPNAFECNFLKKYYGSRVIFS